MIVDVHVLEFIGYLLLGVSLVLLGMLLGADVKERQYKPLFDELAAIEKRLANDLDPE